MLASTWDYPIKTLEKIAPYFQPQMIENLKRKSTLYQVQGEFINYLLREFIMDREMIQGQQYWLDVISNLSEEIVDKNYCATIRITSTIEVQSNEPFEDEQDGQVVREHIDFIDGFLSVPKTNTPSYTHSTDFDNFS